LQPVLEFIGSSHRNDRWEGFAKVMPAAGFPWCLVYFGIDKVLPHLHINFKVSEELNHHGNELPCWFRQLHYNIPKDWLLEFFWWSGSWYSGFYCWSNYISYRIGIQIFEGIAVNAVATYGNE
jgi:hypothetical protein